MHHRTIELSHMSLRLPRFSLWLARCLPCLILPCDYAFPSSSVAIFLSLVFGPLYFLSLWPLRPSGPFALTNLSYMGIHFFNLQATRLLSLNGFNASRTTVSHAGPLTIQSCLLRYTYCPCNKQAASLQMWCVPLGRQHQQICLRLLRLFACV